MPRSKRSPSPRFRVGRISVYPHPGTLWIYDVWEFGRNAFRKRKDERRPYAHPC